MINSLIVRLSKYFNKGSKRSVLAKKNVFYSLVIKIFDFAITLLLVPLLINYLDPTRYGVWITLTSIVAWFGYLDVGLGHGLRNKFTEAIAKNDDIEAKIYVSTAYAYLTLIVLGFSVIFLLINNYIPWYKILNVTTELNSDLSYVALVVFGFFLINFIAKLISTIIVADQKHAIRDLINLISKSLVFVTIYLFTIKIESSLFYLALVYSGIPVIVLLIVSLILFGTQYKKYSPSFKFVDYSHFKQIFGLGWKFLIIQISLIVVLSTDNIIITQLFGPEMVTPYQVANKYFMSVYTIFILILTPLWSASNEALAIGDSKWIKNSVNKVFIIFYLFSALVLILLLISEYIYKIWIGSIIEIQFSLSVYWAVFSILQMYLNIYFYVINGSGRVLLQMVVYTTAMVVNIPLSIYFASYLSMGVNGVIFATIICQFMHVLYLRKQYKLIISKSEFGIWAK